MKLIFINKGKERLKSMIETRPVGVISDKEFGAYYLNIYK